MAALRPVNESSNLSPNQFGPRNFCLSQNKVQPGHRRSQHSLTQNRRRRSIDGDEMDIANKLVGLATRAASNNVVIDVFLVASFVALCARSVNQQNNIEILEAKKESLIKANKAMKKTMWDWKQQLFAEAGPDSSLVPLATLKAIYGEAPAPHIDAVKKDAKSPTSEIVV